MQSHCPAAHLKGVDWLSTGAYLQAEGRRQAAVEEKERGSANSEKQAQQAQQPGAACSPEEEGAQHSAQHAQHGQLLPTVQAARVGSRAACRGSEAESMVGPSSPLPVHLQQQQQQQCTNAPSQVLGLATATNVGPCGRTPTLHLGASLSR